jgi:hypothetical protein
MNANHNRSGAASYLPIALLSLGLFCSCDTTIPSDPRAELLGSLKGENVDGYLFAFNEDEARTTSSLTNKSVRDLVTLGEGDSDLVLGYTRVKDNKANTASTYKSEVVKKDASLALVVTELETNKVIDRTAFPVAGPTCQPPGQFDDLNACINAFECTSGALLCEANRTCKPQFAALTCCLKNGQIFSVHLVFRPTRIRCLIAVPDLEGFVISQN